MYFIDALKEAERLRPSHVIFNGDNKGICASVWIDGIIEIKEQRVSKIDIYTVEEAIFNFSDAVRVVESGVSVKSTHTDNQIVLTPKTQMKDIPSRAYESTYKVFRKD